MLWLCIIALVISGTYNSAVIVKRNQCVNVEGKATILANLYDTMTAEDFSVEDGIIYEINTSSITGMPRPFKVALDTKKVDYFFSENVYYSGDDDIYASAWPYKTCSSLRPELYRYELFEYEGKCYLKVYYAINKNGDGYSAAYVYNDLDVGHIKSELNK